MKTTVTIERGVAFFEDGSEEPNVSVDLFRASPDLLDSCKLAVDHMVCLSVENGSVPQKTCDCCVCESARQILAAISKAEGSKTK